MDSRTLGLLRIDKWKALQREGTGGRAAEGGWSSGVGGKLCVGSH